MTPPAKPNAPNIRPTEAQVAVKEQAANTVDSTSPATTPNQILAPPSFWKRYRKWVVAGVIIAVLAVAAIIWQKLKPSGPGVGFISGNGRVEATDIDIATKLPGRVKNVLVDEGDFVKAGQPLAQMQVDVLDAQRDEARAKSAQAETAVASAEARVAARRSDTASAEAVVGQRTSELDAAQRRFIRTQSLVASGAETMQKLDDDRAHVQGAESAVTAAQAQAVAAQAATKAAQAEVTGAQSGVAASKATIARIEADISDSLLKSPRDGRVQYRVSQPGEVLAAGGKVLNLVDLDDVYMTFFLPETAVGKVALGSEVRVILDTAPEFIIPAEISFVATVAQFTPKTVETASERQKLMFRVRAQFKRELLQKHVKLVKTGLPGVAWLKLDATAEWPANLAIKVPE
jgi:HlyD family secretion protein